jgi:hypothetical protein
MLLALADQEFSCGQQRRLVEEARTQKARWFITREGKDSTLDLIDKKSLKVT